MTLPTRQQMIEAMADPNTANPLAAEIAAAITAYADDLANQAERQRAMPNPLLLSAPRTDVEAFALELFTKEITAAGIRVKIRNTSL
jgi:hypothetical protein